MNRQIIKDELQWLLEAINEQYETIHNQGDYMPQIEFDILMENVRKFYANMYLLQRTKDPLPLKTGSMEPEKPKKRSTPEVKDKTQGVAPEDKSKDESFPADNLPPEPKPAPFKPAGPVRTRKEANPVHGRQTKPVESDLFAGEEPTFTIKLKEAREKTLGPKPPSKHIDNLKTAIVINDKFMFINELFDGNLREYNETIDALNNFQTLNQAADYLDLIRKKNFWDTGSNAFRKLNELLERRY